MKCRQRAVLTAIITLLLSSPVLAIVGGTTDIADFSDPTSDWYGFSMDGIAKARSGSAVAIGNRWFLTAGHFALVPGNTMTMQDGTRVTITNTYTPLTPGSYVDLKLVRVAEEVDFWYDLYDSPAPIGESVIMAGTGYTGTISTRNQFMWSDSTTRDWRWGTNEVTAYKPFASGAYTSDTVQMNFNYNATEYESGLGMSDSGSGSFARDPETGEWALLGINAYASRRLYTYDTSYAISMPSYADWIESIVPTGDLDDDDDLDADDIALLFSTTDALGGGATPEGYELFDLNSDLLLDGADMDFLIHELLNTEYGDANLDGKVSLLDIWSLSENYGVTNANWSLGDFDGNGSIDLKDFAMLAENYGFDRSEVPEPATMSLLALGAMTVLRRRRR